MYDISLSCNHFTLYPTQLFGLSFLKHSSDHSTSQLKSLLIDLFLNGSNPLGNLEDQVFPQYGPYLNVQSLFFILFNIFFGAGKICIYEKLEAQHMKFVCRYSP